MESYPYDLGRARSDAMAESGKKFPRTGALTIFLQSLGEAYLQKKAASAKRAQEVADMASKMQFEAGESAAERENRLAIARLGSRGSGSSDKDVQMREALQAISRNITDLQKEGQLRTPGEAEKYTYDKMVTYFGPKDIREKMPWLEVKETPPAPAQPKEPSFLRTFLPNLIGGAMATQAGGMMNLGVPPGADIQRKDFPTPSLPKPFSSVQYAAASPKNNITPEEIRLLKQRGVSDREILELMGK